MADSNTSLKVKIWNRIIKTATETGFFNEVDGPVDDAMKAFYEEAKGSTL